MRSVLLSLAFLPLFACGSAFPDGQDHDLTASDNGALRSEDLDGDGHGSIETAGDDCDDGNAAVYPGAQEVCADGVDNDCDGLVDAADGSAARGAFVYDGDSDGSGQDYDGDGSVDEFLLCDPSELEAVLGVTNGDVSLVANFHAETEALMAVDCNDANAAVNPMAAEVCNGVDDDCDGSIDDGADLSTYYWDGDGDGFGDASMSADTCEPGEGWVADGTDCDDTDANTYPMAPESCDGLDNDCDPDTIPDESSMMGTWYADGDTDGFGDASMPATACAQPEGTVVYDTDCDDADGAISPIADELCDGIDNNCDGSIDGVDSTDQTTWYRDHDGDLYGDSDFSATSCNAPLGYLDTSGDCDDNVASVYPGAVETMNGIDDNCNTLIDDGATCAIEIELFTGDAGTATISGAVSNNAALDGIWEPMSVDGVSVSSTSLGGDDWYYDVMLNDCLGPGDDIRVDAAFSDGTWGCDSAGIPSGSLRGWQDGLALSVAYSTDDEFGHCVLVVTNP